MDLVTILVIRADRCTHYEDVTMADGGAGRGEMEWGPLLAAFGVVVVAVIFGIATAVHFGLIQ